MLAQQLQSGGADTLKWYLNGRTFTRMTAKGASKYDGRLYRIEFGRHVDWCDKKGGCPRCGTSLQVTLVPINIKDIRPEFNMSIIRREPFVLNYTPARPQMRVEYSIDTVRKERSRRIFGVEIPRIGVFPFVEQIGGREFGEYSYGNGRSDLPLYGGVQTHPFRSYLAALSVGYRGKRQQRFGGLYQHCDCGPVPSVDVWTMRVQVGYNLRKRRNFAQLFVQYEELITRKRLTVFGSGIPKYWRPYGATMVALGVGRQILISDDKRGGAVMEFKLLGVYDMGNFAHAQGQGWALQATAKIVPVGRRVVVAQRLPPDGLERWLTRVPRFVGAKVLKPAGAGIVSAGKWLGKVFKKKEGKSETPPVHIDGTRGPVIY